VIHVVLGMHKSGTTLVSQILHHAGIAMVEEVDEQVGYDQGNQWEREATKQVNHGLLGSEGRYSLDARRRGALAMTPRRHDRMRAIVAECGRRHADWGFKDPRTCLTYAAWAAVLPEHRITVVYRRPEEAWAHYWASTTGRRRLKVFREFLPCWCEYNAAILEAIRTTSMPWIVVPYTRLMERDEEFRRLESFIGRPLSDRREPAMRRSLVRPASFACARVVAGWRSGLRTDTIIRALESLAAGPTGRCDGGRPDERVQRHKAG
jgi:hypothetical protein